MIFIQSDWLISYLGRNKGLFTAVSENSPNWNLGMRRIRRMNIKDYKSLCTKNKILILISSRPLDLEYMRISLWSHTFGSPTIIVLHRNFFSMISSGERSKVTASFSTDDSSEDPVTDVFFPSMVSNLVAIGHSMGLFEKISLATNHMM